MRRWLSRTIPPHPSFRKEMEGYGLAASEIGECSEPVIVRRSYSPAFMTSLIPLPSSGLRGDITKLFKELREPLYRYLLSVAACQAEAEDIAQESFLRLHAHLTSGGSVENPKAWLFRVGYNLAIDGRRRKRFDSLESEPGGTTAEPRDEAAPDPERLAIENQRRDRIARAVNRLSEQQRHCMTLRSEGFLHREIAEILAISESTVAENLRRGVLRLTRELYGT